MNKTFWPKSPVHMTSCFLPHHVCISYTWQLLLHFPLFLSCFIYFAALPIPSRLFCLLFSLSISLSYAWPQLKWVAKIPLTCLQRHPLGTWECHSPFLPLPPLPFSFHTESCHLRVGWGIRKGIVSSTSFYSTLFIYRHVLWWLVGADSFALVSAWSQFNSILRKWPIKKKGGKEGKPQRTQYVLVSWAGTEQMVYKNYTFFRFYWGLTIWAVILCLAFSDQFFPHCPPLHTRPGLCTF